MGQTASAATTAAGVHLHLTIRGISASGLPQTRVN